MWGPARDSRIHICFGKLTCEIPFWTLFLGLTIFKLSYAAEGPGETQSGWD